MLLLNIEKCLLNVLEIIYFKFQKHTKHIEGFNLLIGVPFLKVFEKIFGGTKFKNC